MHRYKLINTGYSSSRYGLCEICNKHVSEVFHQIEEKKYSGGWTRHNCHNLYGHSKCLKAERREV